MSTYNGWGNYETWCVNLWFTSVEELYQLCGKLVAQVRHDVTNTRQVSEHVWTTQEAQQYLLADRLKDLLA